MAWGDNSSGQLGDGTKQDQSHPVAVLSGISSIAAGHSQSLALTNEGEVLAWGGE